MEPNRTIGVRCLAIRQPWAWAICAGAKDIENRSWATEHRGTIAILASGAKTMVNALVKKAKPTKLPIAQLAYGAIIGTAEIVDCVPLSRELESNPWAFGPYCFRLANARLFREPIPAKGKLNLYWLDDALAREVLVRSETAVRVTPGDDLRAWSNAMELSADERFRIHVSSYIELEAQEAVIDVCDRRLREVAGDALALRARGVARYLLDDLAGARADLDAAIERDEEDSVAFYYRAFVRRDLGEDDAEQDFIRAAELDPSLLGEEGDDDGEGEADGDA